MNMNKRAGGGFMEAMVALMISTLALTAFLGFTAYCHSSEPPAPEVSTAFLQELELDGGGLTGLTEEDLIRECADNGYESMVVKVEVHAHPPISLTLGHPTDGAELDVVHGTMHFKGEDGRSLLLAHYEVAVWWR